MRKISGYILLFFSVLFLAVFCKLEGKKSGNHSMSLKKNPPDTTLFQQALNEYLATLDSADQSFYNQIYEPKGMNSFWFSDLKRAAAHIDTLNKVISASTDHGIRPEYFDMKGVVDYAAVLDFKKPDYAQLAVAEIMLTDVYFKYCRGMKFGFINPLKLYPKDYFIQIQQPDSAFVNSIFSNPDSLRVYLDHVVPKNKEYIRKQVV